MVMAARAISAATTTLLRRRTGSSAPASGITRPPPPAVPGMISSPFGTRCKLAHSPHRAPPRGGRPGGATKPVHAGITRNEARP
jgi:hypothetical protein